MTEELKKYMARCDKAIEGLSPCDVVLTETEIAQLGYEDIDFAGAVSGSDEHEFIVYAKENKRIVFVQTYTEREGGLYFQSLYADSETSCELEKQLVEDSVTKPSVNLLETILHFKGVNMPGSNRLFPDNSIYQGCHHFITISHNPDLAKKAIDNYKSSASGHGNEKRLKDERRDNVLKAIGA
jgi:hypothetical protein